ncbi:hypothetical protein PFICI_04516 [Pestalotiopsis fici W106-1]|uniref:Uncharacterized protein n=1 Tax=Pestalotiopsis fici (strain W106-1 / CGMCC3.15140) TaxID=1229662 RepID=W3X9A8_PESFW|nr:uncharacterized protein PFICI_04516 [Pestalotiopsis fici W106-1]ETS82640.1 hypothetical protein PFICI_04516 [Pestalotiopsis fici W106-1]
MLRTTIRTTPNRVSPTAAALQARWSSSNSASPITAQQDGEPPKHDKSPMKDAPAESQKSCKSKTMAELDEEMRLKMSGLSGDGGEAGIEYEDGKPVAMKRSVKNNMFRYI